MTITTGKEYYQIIDTGSVLTYKDEYLHFELAPGFTVSVAFKTDTLVEDVRFDAQLLSNNTQLQLTLYNFNNSVITGNVSPMQIAIMENNQVYLNFAVQSISETQKIFYYTWYKREEVANG